MLAFSALWCVLLPWHCPELSVRGGYLQVGRMLPVFPWQACMHPLRPIAINNSRALPRMPCIVARFGLVANNNYIDQTCGECSDERALATAPESSVHALSCLFISLQQCCRALASPSHIIKQVSRLAEELQSRHTNIAIFEVNIHTETAVWVDRRRGDIIIIASSSLQLVVLQLFVPALTLVVTQHSIIHSVPNVNQALDYCLMQPTPSIHYWHIRCIVSGSTQASPRPVHIDTEYIIAFAIHGQRTTSQQQQQRVGNSVYLIDNRVFTHQLSTSSSSYCRGHHLCLVNGETVYYFVLNISILR